MKVVYSEWGHSGRAREGLSYVEDMCGRETVSSQFVRIASRPSLSYLVVKLLGYLITMSPRLLTEEPPDRRALSRRTGYLEVILISSHPHVRVCTFRS